MLVHLADVAIVKLFFVSDFEVSIFGEVFVSLKAKGFRMSKLLLRRRLNILTEAAVLVTKHRVLLMLATV